MTFQRPGQKRGLKDCLRLPRRGMDHIYRASGWSGPAPLQGAREGTCNAPMDYPKYVHGRRRNTRTPTLKTLLYITALETLRRVRADTRVFRRNLLRMHRQFRSLKTKTLSVSEEVSNVYFGRRRESADLLGRTTYALPRPRNCVRYGTKSVAFPSHVWQSNYAIKA